MMKLSTRCRYGTRALIEIARNYRNGPTKRKDIAKTQGVAQGYLELILSALRAQHFVKTIRGSNGGFALARSPNQISLWEIVLALEGTITPVECIERPESCERAECCAARNAWQRLYDAQKKALSDITLQDLVLMQRGDEVVNWVI